MSRLKDHFKIYPGWEDVEKELLPLISFCFTMDGRLYFKTKSPIWFLDCDCYEFVFDTDNGMYIAEGAMRFNEFMGNRIFDSGVDVVPFITTYLTERKLTHLISK